MRNLKFCANLNFLFKEENLLLNRYDLAKAAGFKGVEVGFPYEVLVEELKSKLEETGLEQILINTFPGDMKSGDLGFAAMPSHQNEFNAAVDLTLKYADALDCKRIHFMSGRLPGMENTPEILQLLESNLRNIVPELEKRNIVGLIEPINKYTVPGYLLSDFDAALSIIKSINSPNIRLQLDFFHLQQIHGNITQRILQLLPYTGHIQIAQVPRRNEPHLDGELNYGYIFDLLEQEKYSGWIGLEYNSDLVYEDSSKGLEEWSKKFNCSLS